MLYIWECLGGKYPNGLSILKTYAPMSVQKLLFLELALQKRHSFEGQHVLIHVISLTKLSTYALRIYKTRPATSGLYVIGVYVGP